MIFAWITGIVLFAALIGASVYAGVNFYKAYNEKEYGREDQIKIKAFNKKGLIGTVLAAILFIAFITVPFSFHTVDTGEVAVVKQLGRAKNVRTAGTYFDLWMVNKYQKYDGKVQNIDIQTAAYSSDAQTMNVAMTLQYQILTDKAMNIAGQYGSLEALTTRVNAIAVEKAKSVLSTHKAMDIIANRQEMSPAVEEAIRSAIGEEYFVNVTAVVLTNIDFSDQFETAVEDKMIAEQAKLKADYENETKIAKAEAEAKAKVTAAEAEAKANELLRQTLTDDILEQMFIDKWDGKLPEVMSGDNLSMILPGNSK